MAKGFGGLEGLLKQAQQMQAKLTEMQEALAAKSVEASAGGGMVQVQVNGQLAVTSVKIDPSVVDKEDVGMLEDLVAAAVNEGVRRARQMIAEEMSKLTGGIKIPGLMP